MKRALALAALALAGGGCATTNPQGSFDRVAEVVADRTAVTAAWPRDAGAEADLRARADEVLAVPLTPESAAQVALWRNRALLAELEEIGISQADYAQATRIANPGFSAARLDPDEPGAVAKVELSLIQDLLDPLLLPLRKRFAAADLEATKMHVGQAMLDLVGEAKAALVHYQAAERLVDRLAVIVEVEEAAVALAERQRAAGNIPQLDLEEQHARLAEARVDKVRAELDARASGEAINRLLGLSGGETAWSAVPLAELPVEQPELSGLESLAVAQRLDLQGARFAVEAVGRALALRRSTRFFPGGIRVGVRREREPDRVKVTGPVLDLELPIFDTGAASIARLEAERRFAERQLEDLAIRVRSQVRELRDRLVAHRELARYYRDTVLPQRVRILDQTLRHYNMMIKGVYDVLLARRLEAEAERAAIETWRDAWMARYELERAVGGRLSAATTMPTPAVEPPSHEHSANDTPGGAR